jgi:hypothetical protein
MEKDENKSGTTQSNKQPGEKIIEGAHNEDQLDKLKQNVPPGGRDAYPERHAGTEPSTGDEKLDQTSDYEKL